MFTNNIAIQNNETLPVALVYVNILFTPSRSFLDGNISSTNIKNYTQHTQLNDIPIKSFNVDICDRNFNDGEKFDFIYLQGIIQHVKDAYSAIKNLSEASKQGAKLWFYNYQAGPIHHLYAEALRKLIPRNINYESLIMKLKNYSFSSKNIDMIIDDLGCTYRNLIKNDNYKRVLEKFGFSRYFTKDLEEQKNGLDLRTKRTACISAYKKSNSVQNSNKINSSDLIHLSHFKPENFIPEQRDFLNEVKFALNVIISKKNKIDVQHDKLFDMCIPLFRGLALHDLHKPFKENKKKLIDDFKHTSQLFGN